MQKGPTFGKIHFIRDLYSRSCETSTDGSCQLINQIISLVKKKKDYNWSVKEVHINRDTKFCMVVLKATWWNCVKPSTFVTDSWHWQQDNQMCSVYCVSQSAYMISILYSKIPNSLPINFCKYKISTYVYSHCLHAYMLSLVSILSHNLTHIRTQKNKQSHLCT